MKFKWPFVRRSRFEAAMECSSHWFKEYAHIASQRLALNAEIKKLTEQLKTAGDEQRKAIADAEREASRNQALIARFERNLDFGLCIHPIRVTAENLKNYPDYGRFELRVPSFSCSYVLARFDQSRVNIPQIADMMAAQWGRQYGAEVTKLIRKQLEEFSK